MAIPAEKLLINIEIIKKYTPINGSVDETFINPFIYVAQDTYLHKYLGTDLFNKIIADAYAGTITGIYETLKDQYIPKVLIWKVARDIYDHMVVHIDNGGLLSRISQDTQTPSQRQIEALKNTAQHNLNNYTTLLVDYLCANSSSIPEYNSNTFPDQYPMRSRTYTVDVLGKRKTLPRWMVS